MEPDWKQRIHAPRTSVSLLSASHRGMPSDSAPDAPASRASLTATGETGSDTGSVGRPAIKRPTAPAPKPSPRARLARAASGGERGLPAKRDLESTAELRFEETRADSDRAAAAGVAGAEGRSATHSDSPAVDAAVVSDDAATTDSSLTAGEAEVGSPPSSSPPPPRMKNEGEEQLPKMLENSPGVPRVATRASNEALFQNLVEARDALLHELDQWRSLPKAVATAAKYAISARQEQLHSARDLNKFGSTFAGLVSPETANTEESQPRNCVLASEFAQPLLQAGGALVHIADVRRASAAEWGVNCVAPLSHNASQNVKSHLQLDRACRLASAKIISAAQAERKQVGVPGKGDGNADQLRSEDILFGEHLDAYMEDLAALRKYHAAERDILMHSWLEQAIGALAAERAAAAAHSAALDAAFASAIGQAHRRMQGRKMDNTDDTASSYSPVNKLKSSGFDLNSLPSLLWQAPASDGSASLPGGTSGSGSTVNTIRKGVFRRGRSQTVDSLEASGFGPNLRTVSTMHSNIVLEGYLTKRGAIRKNWKRRYFVLDSDKLAYYTSETTKSQPIARIYRSTAARYRVENMDAADSSDDEPCFTGDTVVDDKGNKLKPFSGRENLFCLIEPARTWFFQADTASERAHWVKALRDYFCGTGEFIDATQAAQEGEQIKGDKSVKDVYRSEKEGVRTYSTRGWFFMDKPSSLEVPEFNSASSSGDDASVASSDAARQDLASPTDVVESSVPVDPQNFAGTPLGPGSPWRLFFTPDGIEFFTNIHTNETVWERPEI